MAELEQRTLAQHNLTVNVNVEIVASDEDTDDSIDRNNQKEETKPTIDEDKKEEYPILEKKVTEPPRISAPTPPTYSPKFDRRNTPRTPAPKPPTSFPATSSKSQLIPIREIDKTAMDKKTPFHDYTSLACCLLFFFGCTGIAIAAYCKARSAVEAYKRGDYVEYNSLNRQARSYMILSVGCSMVLVLIGLVIFLLIPDDGPSGDVPEK